MTKRGGIKPDPTAIGNIAQPPFVRLPEPETLFAQRAQRLRSLAEGHQLGPYLRLLADISDIQHAIQSDLPAPTLPDEEAVERARQHGMPPLDRAGFEPDAVLEATFQRFFAAAADIAMPSEARSALEVLIRATPEARAELVANVLSDAVLIETVAQHVFVAAVLQVHFARMAAGLDETRLRPVGHGACPSCGGPPATSLVVGWPSAEGTRFCSCATCSTLWNYVRVKCTVCGSTDGISYREIEVEDQERGSATVKAEVCGKCRSYVKILHQQKDSQMDPIADDVASLGLDMLVREMGFARAGANPYLTGY